MAQKHESVLLKETVDLLNIKPDGRYVDGTLGLGGHAEAILKRLSPQGKLLGLDVDPTHLNMAKDRLQPFEDQTITRQVNFRGLQGVLRELGWEKVDGMVVDLGVSSVHFDDPARGFSFSGDGPLDMRLDPLGSDTALTVLRKISEEKLADLFFRFGEHRHSRKIARYLLSDVAEGKITTTKELAGFCERVIGRHGKTHPATRVFLALRVLVNDELNALEELLLTAPDSLSDGGRLAIISFHSLEDRLIKQSFRSHAMKTDPPSFLVLTKKPIVPTIDEVRRNPRARSAKLRVLEKIQ